MRFKFGDFTTKVIITQELQPVSVSNTLFVCDENTKQYADILRGNNSLCVLKSGEENKTWDSVLKILQSAKNAGLGRDGTIFGVGGGVIGDLSGFAASIYMRGCNFELAATTLLSMVDAAVGGKTGFDLFEIKNLAGTFYPAKKVYMPLDTLKTLPEREYKSGMAELIKTMILNNTLTECTEFAENTEKFIKKAVMFKGKLVEKDFKETKGKRALLNLGHTFGHALETAAGLGTITHGEAVAWGIVQACNLGVALNITPEKRANQIKDYISKLGYECATPHPAVNTKEKTDIFKNAFFNDKKKSNGTFKFIVPNKKSAEIVALNNIQKEILWQILQL